MKILVTGAAGFIGMHTTLRLLDEGCIVVGVDCINDYYDRSLKLHRLEKLTLRPNFEFVKLDIACNRSVSALFESHKFDRVIHLAAQAGVRYSISNPLTYGDSNLVGFLNILEASRSAGIDHLVYASSSSVYGANTKTPFSETDAVDHPVSLYAATKRANELMAYSYSHLYQLPTTGLRFFTVYGPWGRPDMAYFSFTDAILRGRGIELYNAGDMQRDFTYIDDIVNGIALVLRKSPREGALSPSSDAMARVPFNIFNIGSQRPTSLLDFLTAIERSLDRTAIRTNVSMQPGDVRGTFADISALEKWVPFKIRTSFDEGVPLFVQWYLQYIDEYGLNPNTRGC